MTIILRSTICALLCYFACIGFGQSIQINEVVSSNASFFDEDGDSPDWFELYNTTQNEISLDGWSVTDKEDNPTKWSFSNISIGPNEYVYFWASGKDKPDVSYPRTLIDRDEIWRYILPNQPVTSTWINLNFNDSNWFSGKTGFGYADNDDVTTIPSGTVSVFMRKTFSIPDKDMVDALVLDIDYDDGFVAYMNGVEIARANILGDRPSFNATTITDHEAQIYNGGRPDRFLIPADVLVNGDNVLSIQAHNISTNSSDFTLIPFLTAFFTIPTNLGVEPPELLNVMPRTAHTNFKLSADETLFLLDADGNEVDKFVLEPTPTDVSIGRRMSDNGIALFDPPTPGMPNLGNGLDGYVTDKIEFSHPGGIEDNLQLTLSTTNAENEIRYTLDASEPASTSPIYANPIPINQTTIVRARIFKSGFIPSNTESKTYLRNVSHDIPVVALVTEPDNLFDNDVGIYELGSNYNGNYPFFGANFWEDWERPIHFTLYENNESGVSFDAGIKIFGGWSRAQDQRSFSFFARGKYGLNEIDYPLFPNNPYDKYQALVLRNSGNDFLRSNIRDGVLTTLMDGSGLETQAFRPVATYINGEYWGLYNMREKVNEHFLASKQNVNPDDVDLMGPMGELIHGDDSDYIALHQYLESNALVSENNYSIVSDQIDIDNFIMYNIAQIYFDNTDWPGNNIKYWKTKEGKWRWILYDTDFGFGVWNPNSFTNNTLDFALEPSGPNWPNPPNSTLMLRRLVGNQTFRHKFINRFADELNSRFLPDNVEDHIDAIANLVDSEINKHYNRWGGSVDFHNEQVAVMKNFARLRPAVVKSQIRSQFNLPSRHELTLQINNPNQGYIRLNSLTITNPFWKGDYFRSVPITITAVAKPGFVFSHWTGDNISTDAEISIDMQSAMTITAIFQVSDEEPNLVINEINYNSLDTEDAGDWIELYNPGEDALDVSKWVFTDTDFENGYTIPDGTTIGGKEFLVLTKDVSKFEGQHPQIENHIGDFEFGLSSQGDVLKVYDNAQNLIDSVSYNSVSPWSEMANGLGYTLELIAPSLDNALAENWSSFKTGGSPGVSNQEVNSTQEELQYPIKFYPNPVLNDGIVEIYVSEISDIKIQIYDVKGALIKTIFDGKRTAGDHKFEADLNPLKKGIYLLEIKIQDQVNSYRWIKI